MVKFDVLERKVLQLPYRLRPDFIAGNVVTV